MKSINWVRVTVLGVVIFLALTFVLSFIEYLVLDKRMKAGRSGSSEVIRVK